MFLMGENMIKSIGGKVESVEYCFKAGSMGVSFWVGNDFVWCISAFMKTTGKMKYWWW